MRDGFKRDGEFILIIHQLFLIPVLIHNFTQYVFYVKGFCDRIYIDIWLYMSNNNIDCSYLYREGAEIWRRGLRI